MEVSQEGFEVWPEGLKSQYLTPEASALIAIRNAGRSQSSHVTRDRKWTFVLDGPCENRLRGPEAESRQPWTAGERERVRAGSGRAWASWVWAGEGIPALGGQQENVGDPGRRQSQEPEQAASVARGAGEERAQPRKFRVRS